MTNIPIIKRHQTCCIGHDGVCSTWMKNIENVWVCPNETLWQLKITPNHSFPCEYLNGSSKLLLVAMTWTLALCGLQVSTSPRDWWCYRGPNFSGLRWKSGRLLTVRQVNNKKNRATTILLRVAIWLKLILTVLQNKTPQIGSSSEFQWTKTAGGARHPPLPSNFSSVSFICLPSTMGARECVNTSLTLQSRCSEGSRGAS